MKTRAASWSVLLLLALGTCPTPDAFAEELKPRTLSEFDAYMRTAEARIMKQNTGAPFLWVDGAPARKSEVRKGKAVAVPWTGKGDIEISDGLIHDWIGAVFVPGATLKKTLALVQDYNSHSRYYKPEVVKSSIVSRDGNAFQVYMQLSKKKVVTVVLNTTHDVQYFPLDDTRCYSVSHSSRIAELDDPGGTAEREMEPNRGHGFLWRLNSFWRFEERDGGVYVECEAISLSKGVPSWAEWLSVGQVSRIVRSLPRESLQNTLTCTRNALAGPGAATQ